MNGRSFPVTDNLYDALKHIRDLLSFLHAGLDRVTQSSEKPVTPLFWIDAICIDQGNLDEKSKEVPKITQIYSKAFTVLIWLGTIEDLQLNPAGLGFLLNMLERVLPVSDFPKPSLEFDGHSGPANSDDTATNHLKIYGGIMMNNWFSLVWVLQQYCLSQRQPIVIIGYAKFAFQSLYGFAPNLNQIADNPDPNIRNKLGSLARMVQNLAKISFEPMYMPEYFGSHEFSQRSAAQKLLWIIVNLGSKKSKVPHDKIYRILGLIDVDSLPSDLRPNYKLPYKQVCRSYTRYLIQENKDLSLLMFSSPEPLENEPSWVVDFRSTSPWALELMWLKLDTSLMTG